MDTFAKRLRAERKRCGFDQATLAKLCGHKGQSFISNLENEVNDCTPSIVELAHALGVDAYWLKTGKGDKFRGSAPLSADEAQIITAYRLFGDEMRRAWLAAARHRIAEEDAVKNKAA